MGGLDTVCDWIEIDVGLIPMFRQLVALRGSSWVDLWTGFRKSELSPDRVGVE